MMFWCLELCLVLLFGLVEGKYGWVVWTGSRMRVSASEYLAEIPDPHVARGIYRNEINGTGWAFLEIHTVEDCSDTRQAFAAGFLEGYLTRDLVWMHWQNMLKGYCANKTDICKAIESFVDKNEDYIAAMVQSNYDDPYWYQVKLYYIQIEGLAMGYNEATQNVQEQLTVRDIVWINMLGDLDELALSLTLPSERQVLAMFPDHCSGLVKLLPDLSNLYTAQATWNSYQSMLRIQKKYVLNYRLSATSRVRIPGYKMAFSSYPAFVQSTDDLYIISSGLVTAETTIGNTNRTLFKLVHPRGQILEYARAMLANRLARNGEEWVSVFRRHNSGTYNNQWYIVDYNKFEPATLLTAGRAHPGLLWVLEQLPGTVEAKDLTLELLRTSYFPSYNIAYFPRIFNLSGGNERVRAFGDWFGYHTNPRAKMFALKQSTIQNLRDMFATMRYNDYLHDPLAECRACHPRPNAANAIAARHDLNPATGTYPFRALGHRSHGATDAKVTSAYLRNEYQFVAVSSPPHNISRGLPPFTWSDFDLGRSISHIGHPDVWTFAPLMHRWEWG
ncbi:putative phospholipase B-like 2 [Choristoneura fumiferana]|uniref:putative phospholipase B-like 2 n=1 Tax=Choristoneura fumiferana TaxID=7141 RepID=UPI003D15B807